MPTVAEDADLGAAYGAIAPRLAGAGAPPLVVAARVAGLGVPGALIEVSAIAAVVSVYGTRPRGPPPISARLPSGPSGAHGDVAGLDGDDDGVACESLAGAP